MSKYETAFDTVARCCSDAKYGIYRKEITNELDILYELVKKETARNVVVSFVTYETDSNNNLFTRTIDTYHCPNCGELLGYAKVLCNEPDDYFEVKYIEHCQQCGQKLNWNK